MIRYSELKNKMLKDIKSLQKDDFYLLEGKLIFKQEQKSLDAKEYLEKHYENVEVLKANNHLHWNNKYETELFFTNLPKGIQA
tara:strand:- start:708 stop:956 length:249 start_codon:yes stop_codon:yes gene_type:complete